MLEPRYIEKYDFLMLPVEGDEFDMGEGSDDSFDWERPVHPIQVRSFFLAEYPVTQAFWQAVMKDTPAHFTGNQRPVEQVSWDDAHKFLEKLRAATRQPFRLPTEAEWEFAARGGKLGLACKYAGSNHLKEVAWFDTNSHGETKALGQKFRNELGLYDMSGNVWEWCEDWFGDSAYFQECKEAGLVIDPTGPEKGALRVGRGGSWLYAPQSCRTAFRFGWRPDGRNRSHGFRLALSLQSVV